MMLSKTFLIQQTGWQEDILTLIQQVLQIYVQTDHGLSDTCLIYTDTEISHQLIPDETHISKKSVSLKILSLISSRGV